MCYYILPVSCNRYYLSERKMDKGRYIGVNYFYRNCDRPPARDPLDGASYSELLRLDDMYNIWAKSHTFFLWNPPAISPSIFIIHLYFRYPKTISEEKIYHKRGLDLYGLHIKKTLKNNKDIVQYKFPDYSDFKIAAETDNYLFLLSGTGQKVE